MQIMLGANAHCYQNTGTYGTPVWSDINIVRDLDLNIDGGEWDASYRGSTPFKASVPTLLGASVEFEVLEQPMDTNFIALRGAFIGRTTLDLAVMNNLITATGAGTEGLRGPMCILNFSRAEHLTEGQLVKVTAKPSIPTGTQSACSWMTVA